MNIEKSCPVCGKSYSIDANREKHGRGKTCSYNCGRKLAAQKLRGPKLLTQFACEQCGKVTECQPYLAKGKRFCGMECSSASQRKRLSKPCARCGKMIEYAPWREDVIYCSRACHNPKAYITCEQCGKQKKVSPSGIGGRNFCSRRCSGKWGHAHEMPGIRQKRTTLHCDTCGKEFDRQNNAVGKNNYCSEQCFYIAHQTTMAGERNPAWRGGFDPYYGSNWNQQRRRARARDNHKCVRCGISEDTLHCKLHVHHIMPLRTFNRDFRQSNALSNLISLCPSCHKHIEWHPDELSSFVKVKIE